VEISPAVKSYLARKRWAYKPLGDNINLAVQTCPFCKKSKWKFNIIASSGVYRCWHCSESGTLYKLKRELGDLQSVMPASEATTGSSIVPKNFIEINMEVVEKWNRQLLRSKQALSYVEKVRGINYETILHFKLGVKKENGVYWLTIPHLENGTCYNVKSRSIPPATKDFRRIKDAKSVLFNSDALAEYEEIVLVEAELDAISFWQAGIKNVVGLTCGAETLLPEWFDALACKSKIYICLDADAVGQDGARKIARRLGLDKCVNIFLPDHDANQVLTSLGSEELAKVIETARPFEVEGVVPISWALSRCKDSQQNKEGGLLTPWDPVNYLLGDGMMPGDLVVLSAKIKVGKTSLALNVAKHLADKLIPSMFYCLEMSVERLARKVTCMVRRKDSRFVSDIDFSLARYYTRHSPLYFVEPDWSGGFKHESVFDKIREIVKRYGIKFVVFDNLHFLCRSLQYLVAEVGQVTRGFKLLAQELSIVIMLIAQPRKIQANRIISYDDLKDSSAIPADADQVILLHRKPIAAGFAATSEDTESILEPKTLVRFDATRYQGGGECYLWFDGATSLFSAEEPEAIRLADVD